MDEAQGTSTRWAFMTLVFIPGYIVDEELWASLEAELEEFRPIFHADISKDDSIAHMARRAVAEAPKRSVVIGFSLGGYVAREIARLAPDRVEALVLVATSSRADTADQARRKSSAVELATRPFKGLSRASIQASLHSLRRSDDELISRIRDMGIRLGHDVFLRQSGLKRESDFARLGGIRCPTLIVAGEQDQIRCRDEALELHAGIANSMLETIPNSGHMIPLEQPAALATVIRSWLGGLKADLSQTT